MHGTYTRLDPKKKIPIEQAFFPHIKDEDYLPCRNTIVESWLGESNHILSDDALKKIGSNTGLGFSMTFAISSLLTRYGYINYGMIESDGIQFSSNGRSSVSSRSSSSNAKKVAVIGAGMAGLCTGRQLKRLSKLSQIDLDVDIYEGGDKVGGRMYSAKVRSSKDSTAVDIGAQIITGFEGGNPMDVVIRRQLQLPVHYIEDPHSPLYGVNGKVVPQEIDEALEGFYNQILALTSSIEKKDNSKDGFSLGEVFLDCYEHHVLHPTMSFYEHSIVHWHLANLEFANCTPLDQVDLWNWDQDDDFAFKGNHAVLVSGYQEVAEKMSDHLNIHYNQTVTKIKHRSRGVEVFGDGEMLLGYADRVVVTSSLGVLKSNLIEFDPQLPNWKYEAIENLGFGTLNKVALLFESVFWPKDAFHIGIVTPSSFYESGSLDYDRESLKNDRGFAYLFLNAYKYTGMPILIAFNSGMAALNQRKPQEEISAILKKLRNAFGSKVSKLVDYKMSDWKNNKLIQGSYSFIKVNSSGDDYDILAEPISPMSLRDADKIVTTKRNVDDLIKEDESRDEWKEWRVFFAGEATCKNYPATVPGAFISGLRESAAIINILDCERYYKSISESKKQSTVKCYYPGCGMSIPKHLILSHVMLEHIDKRILGVSFLSYFMYLTYVSQNL